MIKNRRVMIKNERVMIKKARVTTNVGTVMIKTWESHDTQLGES